MRVPEMLTERGELCGVESEGEDEKLRRERGELSVLSVKKKKKDDCVGFGSESSPVEVNRIKAGSRLRFL
jgi:hypothetical protein